MKLIYLANIRIPTGKAHGIQIMKMCEAFSLAGLETELLVPWRFNKIKEDAFDYYGVKRIFKLKKLPSLDLIPLNIPYLGFWIQGFSFGLSALFYLLFKKFDCLYCRDLLLLPMIGACHRKLIFEAHYFPKNFWLYKRTIKKSKAIITITQKLKGAFEKEGINPEKILVAPDGVDLEQFDIKNSQFACRQKLNLPIDKKIILYTGHLYQWKGAQVLADAAKFLNKNCLVVFVGGTEKEIKEFRIKNRELSHILIISHRPYQEIPYWLKAADILVLPNSAKEKISRFWTSPMKMFEYLASQKPIIASNLPSLREILNKNNALLVKPDQPAELAKAIIYLLKNPDFSDRVAQQAFLDAKKYTWLERAKSIINFFN